MNDRILIVEDEKDLREIYTMILSRSGYKTAIAKNGKEALDAVRTYKPRLVLLDIFMPVMDGQKFLESLDGAANPDMKVIVCSNTSDQNLLSKIKQLGVEKIVTKSNLGPLDMADLVRPYMSSKA